MFVFVFVAAHELSLAVLSRGCTLVAMHGLLIVGATLVVEHGLWGLQAQLPCGMRDPPQPGIQLVFPALAGRFPTTGPPGATVGHQWKYSSHLQTEAKNSCPTGSQGYGSQIYGDKCRSIQCKWKLLLASVVVFILMPIQTAVEVEKGEEGRGLQIVGEFSWNLLQMASPKIRSLNPLW